MRGSGVEAGENYFPTAESEVKKIWRDWIGYWWLATSRWRLSLIAHYSSLIAYDQTRRLRP